MARLLMDGMMVDDCVGSPVFVVIMSLSGVKSTESRRLVSVVTLAKRFDTRHIDQ
jgi:hypothetical protein